jgi:hypothetical protein
MYSVTEIRKQNAAKKEAASISAETRFAPLANGDVLVNHKGKLKTFKGSFASALLDKLRGKNPNQQRDVIATEWATA